MSSQDFEPFLLSPFDHVWPPVLYAVTTLYFGVNQGLSTEDVVKDLHCGLERLIHIVPFLGGVVTRAQVEGKSNVMMVQPESSSASCASLPFIQVKRFPQYGLPTRGDSILNDDGLAAKEGSGDECTGKEATPRLMPGFDRLTKPDAEPYPVFRAQINVLADGVALVLAVNHMVFDGKGNDVLMSLLAQCCRDPVGAEWPAASAAAQVDARRYLDTLGRNAASTRLESSPVSQDINKATTDPTIQGGHYAQGEGLVPEDSSAFYNFRFSAARVQALKAECTMRLPALLQRLRAEHDMSSKKLPDFVSSTDVLTAVLWMSAAPAMASEQQTSILGCAVDSRKKFPQALANDFMGNTVAYGETTLAIEELHECKVGGGDEVDESTLELLTRIAYRVRCCIADVDGPSLAQRTAEYSQNADWSQILVTRCDFIVSSLREWSLFGLDFGPRVGRARSMEYLPPSTVTGECLIKPATLRQYAEDGKGEKGDKSVAWEVMVTLRADQVEQMCETQLIRWPLENVSQIRFYRRM